MLRKHNRTDRRHKGSFSTSQWNDLTSNQSNLIVLLPAAFLSLCFLSFRKPFSPDSIRRSEQFHEFAYQTPELYAFVQSSHAERQLCGNFSLLLRMQADGAGCPNITNKKLRDDATQIFMRDSGRNDRGTIIVNEAIWWTLNQN